MLDSDFRINEFHRDLFHVGLLTSVSIKPVAFLFGGRYRSIWRYASLQDAVKIFKNVAIASIAT